MSKSNSTTYRYRTQYTCSSEIRFELEDGVIRNLVFTGGCNGNLKALSRLAEGMPAEEFISRCGGITCGSKPTSCSDQFARALRLALDGKL